MNNSIQSVLLHSFIISVIATGNNVGPQRKEMLEEAEK
jgi:hypothetical protein